MMGVQVKLCLVVFYLFPCFAFGGSKLDSIPQKEQKHLFGINLQYGRGFTLINTSYEHTHTNSNVYGIGLEYEYIFKPKFSYFSSFQAIAFDENKVSITENTPTNLVYADRQNFYFLVHRDLSLQQGITYQIKPKNKEFGSLGFALGAGLCNIPIIRSGQLNSTNDYHEFFSSHKFNPYCFLSVNASKKIKLNKHLILEPTVSYNYLLSNIADPRIEIYATNYYLSQSTSFKFNYIVFLLKVKF
ncbi:MAG: hypothetical protein CFE21_13785 [Bacteroidetes bacterium B1(2017)]|nr:MAG: hypothetical protein CFE21_13785 [Bacteroidetes bacterium B1(2017)]